MIQQAKLWQHIGYYKKSFILSGAKLWKFLPYNLKEEKSLQQFKEELKCIRLSAAN